jgi:hypothetical protein
LDGPVTRLHIRMAWTPETVTLSIDADGQVPVEIGVSLPLADRRGLVLVPGPVVLVERAFRPTVDF